MPSFSFGVHGNQNSQFNKEVKKSEKALLKRNRADEFRDPHIDDLQLSQISGDSVSQAAQSKQVSE